MNGELDGERWALVQRVVSSPHFAKAPQLREFLLYIAAKALAGKTDEINEHQIGHAVLGRRTDFNPSEDNIVRVQARHLRKKLEAFFASEGRDDPTIITIPKGSYIPRFEPRYRPEGIRPKYPRILLTVLASLVAVLAAALIALWVTRPRALPEQAPSHPFWSKVFAKGQQTNIVVADSCHVMVQDILGMDVPLSDYLSRDYPQNLLAAVRNRDLRSALELIVSRQYTSLGDTNISTKLLQLSGRYDGKAAIRYARHLNIRQFKTDNFILIGSRRGIPWLQLFEPRLNFAFEREGETSRFRFRNKAPRPGEQQTYQTRSDEAYADIALLRNLGETGYVLVLSGITMEATEAAGELAVSPNFTASLAKMMGSQAAVEILVRTKVVAGAARETEVVTYR